MGAFNSPESRKEYARVVAELAVQAAPPPALARGPSHVTVDEILLPFWKHVERHYRDPDGHPTTEVDEFRRSLAPLRRLYGHTPAAAFGPKALAAVRQEMVGAGWSRPVVNRRVGRVVRAFKWAPSEELVPVVAYQSLRTLAGLQRGRTEARNPIR